MKIRQISTFCACVLSLSISSAVSAAFYDFEQWVQDNGEQGFDNSTPLALTVDGLQLIAKANNKSQSSPHVYFDDSFGGSTGGGMGVCSELDVSNQCLVDSSVERDDNEALDWTFGTNILSISLEFDNNSNGFASRKLQYKYATDPWKTVTTDALGSIIIDFDGSSDNIQFRAKGKKLGDEFYIVNADVTAVPVPASIWLFLSGMLGMLFITRRS